MHYFGKMRSALLTAALLMPFGAASTASALTFPGRALASPAAAGPIIQVHVHRHHTRRHHHRRHVVDAPFTRVETGRRVVVDAPFAHVRVNRRGRHIRAPFVDLWLPR